MDLRILLLIYLIVFASHLRADGEQKSWSPSDIVIVISMDGMRYDYPDKAAFPGFMRMEKEGLRVQKMLPTFPASTFPSHVSLATGTTPEKHGIIDNHFYDKVLGKSFDKAVANQWLEAEPIWVTAERQGKRTAIYYWLGSEGAWHGVSASYNKLPFNASVGEQAKVDQIIQWIDLPLEKRPQLIMSYWHGADSEGHLFGPDSFMVRKKIAQQDYFLQKLQKAIDERAAWGHVSLIVVSDHGMTEKGTAINLQTLLNQGKINAYFNMSSAVVHINFKKSDDKNNQKSEAFNFLKKQSGFEVYYPELMPKIIHLNHASRSGELILVANHGFYFSNEGLLEKGVLKIITGGMHGLPATDPDMATIFFAEGRGVQQGSILNLVNMIDVAPSIASLLNISAPLQSQGKAFLPNINTKN